MLSIKYKLPLILIAIISLFGLASSWVSNIIIMPPFQEMDEQRINKNMQRNINALLNNIEGIERLAKDWGMWDDSYIFVQNHNQDFVKTNLTKETFENNNIDAMIFLNSNNEMVWGGFFDRDLSIVSPAQQEETRITLGALTIDLAKIRRTAGLSSGFYLSGNSPIMFAMSPSLDTKGTKPVKGRIMMLKLVTPKMIKELQQQTESVFELIPNDGKAPTAQQQQLIRQLATSSQSVLLEQGEDLLEHNVMATAEGGHLLVSVKEKKSFAALAKTLVDQVIVWLVIGGLMIFIATFYLVQRYLVSPVLKIIHHVQRISESKNYSLRLKNKSQDETGELSRCIDSFVEKISDNLVELEGLNQVQKRELDYRKNLEFNLQRANEQLKRLASIDGLTGLANRRIFDEKLSSEWRRMQRHQRYLTVVLLDIDHFKKFNDSYGHLKGDDCLIEVARTLRKLFKRSEDLVARYGGEEFVIILPECPPETAKQIGEEVVSAISGLYIAHEGSETGVVTCSAGVCSVLPHDLIDCEDLLMRADENLYKAKATGRNQSWFSVMRDIDVRTDELLNRNKQSTGLDDSQYKGLL